MGSAGLLDGYEAGIDLLRGAVAGMSPEQARTRPVAGKWSTLEVVAHLSDFEPIYADRIKRILAEDRPLIMAADENLFARRLAYHDRDLDSEVELITLTRRQLATVLRAVPEADWQREGVHNELGIVTVEHLISKAVQHIRHHVPFISAKRAALGMPPAGEASNPLL